MHFIIILSLSLAVNAIKVQSDMYIDSLNLTSSCTKALQTDLECDDYTRTLGKYTYQGWVGSNRLVDAICTATCFTSLQKWNETVTKDCAEDRTKDDPHQLQTLIADASDIQLMWNVTCIKDTSSGRYCLDVIYEQHGPADGGERPYKEPCDPCYGMVITALLNSSIDAHLWLLDDDYWKGQLKLVHENCSSPGQIEADFEAQKMFNASHGNNRTAEPEPNDGMAFGGNPTGGPWIAALVFGLGILVL
ncbi:uncharacterized protein B0J16DRAFT_375706 [Fusarium flagelliforme]|uniref:uncharacterized protein n=1 Tax=Fusarium flagelliforme TaxID=2675880 RepID=UPI001E8D3237|nr:uncharacterized protein B0J16DRAFT_375706 [Fusarium flagelliforme]KAH7174963.1 hypothetical protein B0J16DRAFT_375706 [Fusarium flagelliforme]